MTLVDQQVMWSCSVKALRAIGIGVLISSIGVLSLYALEVNTFAYSAERQHRFQDRLEFVEEITNSTEPLRPLPEILNLDLRKVTLGRKLFHDTKLSSDGTISCASCHHLARGGVDRIRYSVGVGGKLADTNTPTVLNSAFNFRFFWDGRAESLEDQIDGPISNENEMATTWPEIVLRLNQEPEYKVAFAEIYSDGITVENIKTSLATFERSLSTPNAKIDLFLRGDKSALNAEEIQGYQLFKQLGCVSCHQGVNIGGNMFQTFGVMADYFKDRGNVSKADFGLYNVTKRESDRYRFKVPSLRNVAQTAPYFHDGSAPTLEHAVLVMGRYQLGQVLSTHEVELIVKFLGTLTGKLPE